MSERLDAIKLANRLLDEPGADPDDDLRMLSRQLLRSVETIDKMHTQLQKVDWQGQAEVDLIHANRDAILDVYREAVRRIHRVLVRVGKDDKRLDLIQAVIVALNQFHPMHGESFPGWPKESD